jgi:predicted Zn-dependent protease
VLRADGFRVGALRHTASNDSAAARARRAAATLRGTYLADILAERDSALSRWPDRTDKPVRVWVQNAPTLPGWRRQFPDLVRVALDEWSQVGIPVRFVYVTDPSKAEVRVRWVERLNDESCGESTWTADAEGWMRRADITLAMRSSDGVLQDERDMRAMALHEAGHLLGLGHTSDTTAIMAPWVAADDLTEADRATVRALYALRPGPFVGE